MDENPKNPVPHHWESHKIGRIQQVLAMLNVMEEDVKAIKTKKGKDEMLEGYLYRIREALDFPNIYEAGFDGPNKLISAFLKSQTRSQQEMIDHLQISAHQAYVYGTLKSPSFPLPRMNNLIQTRGYDKVLRMKDRERYRQAKIHKHL